MNERGLKLFAVPYDGEEDFVEATSMQEAIDVWHDHRRLTDDDWDRPAMRKD